MVIMKMVTKNIFIKKSIHWKKIIAKKQGWGGDNLWRNSLSGKNAYKKNFH